LIEKWERLIGARVRRFFVQRMKTKWGSCNDRVGSIRLNTDLARKPLECLEYIVVHEMVHLLEPTHNARFMALMDQFMPSGNPTATSSTDCRCGTRAGITDIQLMSLKSLRSCCGEWRPVATASPLMAITIGMVEVAWRRNRRRPGR
jgi:hypothetical protein